MAAWLIRVQGKQRDRINVDLVVRALVLLERQIEREQAARTGSGVEIPVDGADTAGGPGVSV
jgi:hypothetical protein